MTDKKEIVVDIDANIEDADWPKRTNDVFFDKNHPQAAKPKQRHRSARVRRLPNVVEALRRE